MQWIHALGLLGVAAVLNAYQLPGPVAKQIETRYAEMQVVAVEQDDDDGALVYEVKLRDNERLIEADFDAEGNFLSSEEDIVWTNVPQAVQSPFAKAYPQVVPVEVTCYHRNHLGKELVTYVIEFHVNGKEREMGVNDAGKVLFDRLD